MNEALFQLISYFFIYSFLGWCMEIAYAALKKKHFYNRGVLNGPLCPVYGIGMILILTFFSSLRESLVFLADVYKRQHQNCKEQLFAPEFKPGEAVCRYGGGYNREYHLRQNDRIRINHGFKDINITAIAFQRVLITVQRRILRDETNPAEYLIIRFKGSPNHPDQRINHDEAHYDQHYVAHDRIDSLSCLSRHLFYLPSSSE